MAILRAVGSFVLALLCSSVFAGAPTVDAPVPLLSVSERGELTMSGDDFKFVPWRSDASEGKVQVIQYFGANVKDSEIFKPLTDALDKTFEPGVVQVVTVLNLEAAMWGTTGFVLSELEKNKRKYPLAVLVVDDKATGVTEWELGEAGTGLIITDTKGIVKYFTRQALNDAELATALALVKSNVGS